jgi:hypothetical protein
MDENIGKVFGRLTVLEKTAIKSKYHYSCQCSCGNVKEISFGNLVKKNSPTLSCGCLRNENITKICGKHLMAKSKEYKSWSKVKERTGNPKTHNYCDYGDKGFLLQDSWHSFQAFIDYMGLMPKDGKRYTIDRIQNHLGYIEGNVRWATNHEQARNKTKPKNNSSGFVGVAWHDKPSRDKTSSLLYATAIWYALEGKKKSKCFSVKTYGLLPAFKLAVEYRNKMIAELNSQGAGYTELHGK